MCALSECDGMEGIAGLVVDGGVFVAEVVAFAPDGFFALAFVRDFFFTIVFFAAVFEGVAFGLAAGFFFVVSGAGIVCPSCWASTGVLTPRKTARTADKRATLLGDIG